MEEQKPKDIYYKLQNIDRRILYLILLICVAVPTLIPFNIPNAPLPMSKDLWQVVDACPKDKLIVVSSQWTNATRGENKSQTVAILSHIMSKHIKFATSSFVAAGSQVIKNTIVEVSNKYGYDYQYGRDYVDFGFQSSAPNFIKSFNSNLLERKDTILKLPLNKIPAMSGIKSSDDVYIVIDITASDTYKNWMQFIKPGVKLGFCSTSVMAPEAVPYYQTGQLAGILWGAKGGYDYESLNADHNIGSYSFGKRYIAPLTCAFMLIIISIAVGNISMFISNKRSGGNV